MTTLLKQLEDIENTCNSILPLKLSELEKYKGTGIELFLITINSKKTFKITIIDILDDTVLMSKLTNNSVPFKYQGTLIAQTYPSIYYKYKTTTKAKNKYLQTWKLYSVDPNIQQ